VPPADDLPRHQRLLWGLEGARRGPRPGQTIEGIGAAAVALADAHGLPAVSMKAVATSLGLATMALYRYVESKEGLYEVMLDQAYGVPPPEPPDGGWRERLDAWARSLAGVLLAHPWVVDVPTSSPAVTPNVLAWTDRGVAALAATALDGQQRLSSLLLLDGFVRQHTRLSLQMGAAPLPGRTTDTTGGEAYARTVAQVLDPARLPSLAGAFPALDDDGDFYAEELEFGLSLVLDGVGALVGRSATMGR
jgi:AcrR family transcriptional regulator